MTTTSTKETEMQTTTNPSYRGSRIDEILAIIDECLAQEDHYEKLLYNGGTATLTYDTTVPGDSCRWLLKVVDMDGAIVYVARFHGRTAAMADYDSWKPWN